MENNKQGEIKVDVNLLMDRIRSRIEEKKRDGSYSPEELEKIEGFVLHKVNVSIGNGLRVEVDAANVENDFYGEICARLTKIQPAHIEKVSADMLKLQLIEHKLDHSCRKVLCFADLMWGKFFAGKSWVAEAARSFGIQIVVVKVPEEILLQVFAAQRRQKLVNAT